MQHRSKTTRGILVLGWMILLAVPAAGQFNTRRLSEFQTVSGRVLGSMVTPDGSRVVYRANPTAPEVFELFSVPSDGGVVTQLSGPLVAGGEVLSFVLSDDGTQVLYLANGDDFDKVELYTVPVVGGTVVKLNGPMHASGEVRSMAFSPDGSRAVFVADQEAAAAVNLYSVSIGGGAPTQLSTLLPSVEVESFQVSSDSSRVVYLSNENFSNSTELFSVPLTGGAVTQLNAALPAGRDVEEYVLTPSGEVVFSSESAASMDADLFSVPLAGGAVEQLNGEGVGDVRGPLVLSPSGSHVVFVADIGAETSELSSLDLGTDNFSNLSGDTISVESYEVTPDGASVLFTVRASGFGGSSVSRLFIVPLGGGTATQLDDVFASDAIRFAAVGISSDSSRVVYLANADDTDFNELFAVSASGGAVQKLNPSFTVGEGVEAFVFDSDGDAVIYLADQDTPELPELYTVPWAGGASTRLNPALAAGGEVSDFVAVSGDVFFTAEGEALEVIELYGVAETGGMATKLSDTPTATVGQANLPILNPDETIAVFSAADGGNWGLYSVDLTIVAPPVLLSDPIASNARINNFAIDPTGQRVVFEVDYSSGPEVDALFSVPIGGGAVVPLSDPADGNVDTNGIITSDGQFVVYSARIGGGTRHLFSVPMLGGAIQQLSGAEFVSSYRVTADHQVVFVEGSEIFVIPVRDGVATQLTSTGAFNNNFNLSPDEATVAFQEDGTGALSTVPTAGGSPPKILNNNGGFPLFTPDGQRIVYRYSPGVLLNLFTIPTVGGAPVQLNDRSQHEGLVEGFRISPDSSRAVMRMAQSNQPYLLASAPTAGGDMVVLEDVGSVAAADGVLDFAITADSSQVVFLSNRVGEVSSHLYSIDIDGGMPMRLDPTGNVQEMEVSADGSRVYYAVIQPGVPDITELRTVPVNGGPALRMHPPLAPNREVSGLRVTSDGQKVLYRSDQDADGVFHLHLSELNGALFQDGFESGNTLGWSAEVP